MDSGEDRRAEIYLRGDMGYYSVLPETHTTSSSRRLARALSPILVDSLSPSARRLLGRTLLKDIQREINAV